MTGYERRKSFVDWVEDRDAVRLDDFTRDGYQTVYLDVDATPDPEAPPEVVKRATDAGYTHRWWDQQGRLVFSTDDEDPRTRHLSRRIA